MDYDIERWMDATDDDDEEMLEPSPYVIDVQTEGMRTVEFLDTRPLAYGVVTDVSGQLSARGRGYAVRKTVVADRLVDMTVERI